MIYLPKQGQNLAFNMSWTLEPMKHRIFLVEAEANYVRDQVPCNWKLGGPGRLSPMPPLGLR